MGFTNKRVLVVTAHPDDETLCSGTLARLSDAGNHITLLIATTGNRGTTNPLIRPEKLAEKRKNEMAEAAVILGIQEVAWLGYDDGGLFAENNSLKERVFHAIRTYDPDIVFSFDPEKRYDFHSDHRTIGQVTTEATYLRRCLWYYPQHMAEGRRTQKPVELYLYQPEEANCQVDVSEYVKRKLAAGVKHTSQNEDADIQRMMRLEGMLNGVDGRTTGSTTTMSDDLRMLHELCVESFRKVYDTTYHLW